jgi:hypothetical protein
MVANKAIAQTDIATIMLKGRERRSAFRRRCGEEDRERRSKRRKRCSSAK